MTSNLLATFYQLPDEAVQEWLEAHREQLSWELVEAGKAKAEEMAYGDDLDKALAILNRAMVVSDALQEPLAEVLVWRGRANVLQAHERYTESLAATHQAVALCEQHGTPYDVAKARTVEVKILGVLERFDEAIDLALWIRPIYARHGFTYGQARLTDNLAQVYTWAWRLEEALPEYRRARKLYLKLELPLDAARVLHNMGVLANRMDQLELARHYYKQAYPEFEAANDLITMVKTQFNLARICLRQGKYEATLDHLAQARTDLLHLPESPDSGYVNLHEAQVRWRLNQTAEAEALLREALERFEGLNRRLEAAETLMALGRLLATDPTPKKRAERLDYLEQAEVYLQESNVPLLLAWVQLEQAEQLFRLERTQKAAKRAEMARSTFTEAALTLREAQAEALLADCCSIHQPEKAQGLYQSALGVAKEADPLLAVRCWHGLGRLAASQGIYHEAEEAYEQAVTLLDSVRRALSQHRQQAGFLEDKQALIEELLTVLHKQPKSEVRLLTWVERFKAGALAELLVGLSPQSSHDHNDQFQSLLAQHNTLRAKLDHWESQLRGEIGFSESFALRRGVRAQERYTTNKRTELHRKLQTVEEELARQHSAAYEWHEGSAIEPQAVHQLLSKETMLLSYYTAQNGQLYALTATQSPHDLQIHHLETTLEEIASRWNQTVRLMMRPNKRLKALQKRLADLWNRLIQPMEERLRGKKRLLLLPYRNLFQIPFAGLYDSRTKRYLIEDWTVQIAPSATVLSKCQQFAPSHETAHPQGMIRGRNGENGDPHPLTPSPPRPFAPSLLIGYPGQPYLAGVEPELKTLKKVLPNAEVLFADGATLANVMERLPNRPLIHIAGHIIYDSEQPLASRIPLAGKRMLRASDLYLRYGYLSGSTVVLSGCQSASGSAQGGDILGLTSAFLYAGAAGIIAALWPVDDAATATLMPTLYQGFSDGLQSADALHRAQTQLLHHKPTSHPYYWAPFVLNGASQRWRSS